MDVSAEDSPVVGSAGGYRFKEATNGVIFREAFNRFAVLANTPWTLEFLPAPYSIAPTNRTITTRAGRTNQVQATYKTWGQMQAAGGNVFHLVGSSGVVYRIEHSARLGSEALWTAVRTQMVGSAGATFTNLAPGATNGFFRAVLLP